jgi:hypothetical protein
MDCENQFPAKRNSTWSRLVYESGMRNLSNRAPRREQSTRTNFAIKWLGNADNCPALKGTLTYTRASIRPTIIFSSWAAARVAAGLTGDVAGPPSHPRPGP